MLNVRHGCVGGVEQAVGRCVRGGTSSWYVDVRGWASSW